LHHRTSPTGTSNTGYLNYCESIIATLREPFLVLDDQLRVKTANRRFYETFKVSAEETEKRFIYDFGNRQWDIRIAEDAQRRPDG
jgi:PAS domain-containing protein